MTPLQAGWYAGADVWRSTYGPAMNLAPDARKFDVSPAWQAWIGAEQSLALFAGLDLDEVWSHTSALGDALCDAVGIQQQHRPIVTWPDSSGDDLGKLMSAGIRCSGRGRPASRLIPSLERPQRRGCGGESAALKPPVGWLIMAASTPLDAVINLAKRRGFVFQSGEIYGGSRSAWDYGPLGTALKENIKREWWKFMVQSRDDIVGIDSAIILPKRGVGGLGSRRGVQRPAHRVPALPPPLPGRPPRRGVRAQEGPRSGERPRRHCLPELRHARSVDRAESVLGTAQDLPRSGG